MITDPNILIFLPISCHFINLTVFKVHLFNGIPLCNLNPSPLVGHFVRLPGDPHISKPRHLSQWSPHIINFFAAGHPEVVVTKTHLFAV